LIVQRPATTTATTTTTTTTMRMNKGNSYLPLLPSKPLMTIDEFSEN